MGDKMFRLCRNKRKGDEKIRIMHVSGQLDVGGLDELLWITAKFNLQEKYDLAYTACQSSDG